MTAMTYQEKLQKTREWRARQATAERASLICKVCGETLRRPVPDALCGWCREGVPMDCTSPNWNPAA